MTAKDKKLLPPFPMLLKEFCKKYNVVIPVNDIGYAMFYDFIVNKLKEKK